jgi:hypothetical protein
MDEQIRQVIDILRQTFTVVLALALGEAFKQVVADVPAVSADPAEKPIRWDRFAGLVAFLLLLTPFYQGMARYLFHTYSEGGPQGRPEPYGVFLLIDCAAFTIEAGLFFVMARALSTVHWRRFYTAVFLILSTDAVLGTFVWLIQRWPQRTPDMVNWLVLDIIALPVFGALLLIWRDRDSRWAPRVGLACMVLRTVADYWSSWKLYFP